MIDNKTGKDRRCAQCGDDEFRIDGFCSTECRNKAEYEEEINDLLNQLAETKDIIASLRDEITLMKHEMAGPGWAGGKMNWCKDCELQGDCIGLNMKPCDLKSAYRFTRKHSPPASPEWERGKGIDESLTKLFEEEVNRYKEALIWCSGSEDFNVGGKAREGWVKICQPLIKNNNHE